MINFSEKYKSLIKIIEAEAPFQPEICVVLGSGLGDFADKVDTKKSIATSSLDNYPKSTVQGHSGYLHFSEYKGKKLLIVQGRIHFYEGYDLEKCVLPIFIAAQLKTKNIILTNAAGGVNTHFHPGDLMLASSFNAMNIKKELSLLISLPSIEAKNAFFDFPSEKLNSIIMNAALDEKILLKQGVYWLTKGPSYETPAEIKMVQKFGGDAVGMSTVHEAIFAKSLGVEASSISCITNYAAGLSAQKLSHKEVMETAEIVKKDFERLIKKSIELL
jgi:purine-nucleoside phosphorylase